MPQDPNETWAELPDGRTVLAESFGEKLEVPEMGKPFPAPSPVAEAAEEPTPAKSDNGGNGGDTPTAPSKWAEVSHAQADATAEANNVENYPASGNLDAKTDALKAAGVKLADVKVV